MDKKKEIKPKNVLITSTIVSIAGIIALVFVFIFVHKLITTSGNIDTFGTLYIYLIGIAMTFYAGLCILPNIIGGNIEDVVEAYKKIK